MIRDELIAKLDAVDEQGGIVYRGEFGGNSSYRIREGHRILISGDGFIDYTTGERYGDRYPVGRIASEYIRLCESAEGLATAKGPLALSCQGFEIPPPAQFSRLEKPVTASFVNVDISRAFFTIYRNTGLGAVYRPHRTAPRWRLVFDGVELVREQEWGELKAERNAVVGLLRREHRIYYSHGELTPLQTPKTCNLDLAHFILGKMLALSSAIVKHAAPLAWNVDGGHWLEGDPNIEVAKHIIEDWGFSHKIEPWHGTIFGPGLYSTEASPRRLRASVKRDLPSMDFSQFNFGDFA